MPHAIERHYAFTPRRLLSMMAVFGGRLPRFTPLLPPLRHYAIFMMPLLFRHCLPLRRFIVYAIYDIVTLIYYALRHYAITPVAPRLMHLRSRRWPLLMPPRWRCLYLRWRHADAIIVMPAIIELRHAEMPP